MYNFQTIKESISPKDVAMKYLGNPSRKSNGRNWYSSPFRRDSTPSFVADEKGFYDFGDNQYYDIIGLVSKIFNIHLKNAAILIAKDFNLTHLEDSISHEQIEKIKIRRIEQIEKKEEIERFYCLLENFIINEIKVSNHEIYYLDKIFCECNLLSINEEDKIMYSDYLADQVFRLEEYKENLSRILSGINNCSKEEVYKFFKENDFDYKHYIKEKAKFFANFADEDEVKEYRNLGLHSRCLTEQDTMEL